MNNHDEETEIKIEYYETLDVDPLSEIYEIGANKNVLFHDTISASAVVSNDNKLVNQESECKDSIDQFNKNPNSEDTNHEIAVTTWYKSINNDGRYLCKFCNLSYSTVQTIRNHVKLKHADNYSYLINKTTKNIRQSKIKCHICNKRFKDINALKGHIEDHGMGNIRKSCHTCHATFENGSELLNHISNKTNSCKMMKYICSTCGYNTNKLSHYKQHTNTHLNNNKKKCPYCDYSTNYLPNLKIHVRTHTNDKPYKCDYEDCDYRCAAKSALYSHSLKHDKENNMMYCDKCSYKTVYKQSLKKHIDSHKRNNIKLNN